LLVRAELEASPKYLLKTEKIIKRKIFLFIIRTKATFEKWEVGSRG
jgi:hypothetical protein